jgi:hypothetical protein
MILCICNGVRSSDLDRYHLIGTRCGRCIDERKKERERKERIQHPHMIKSRSHWDNEQAYWDLLNDKCAQDLGKQD